MGETIAKNKKTYRDFFVGSGSSFFRVKEE